MTMAAKEQGKGVKVLDKKSMKHTKGGIIVVCKTATGAPDMQGTELGVRKAGEKPLEY
jgi:hypothetical protein